MADPDWDAILQDLIQKPKRVMADGQAVETHDLKDIMDAINQRKASTCRGLTYGMIQRAYSGPAYGA